MFIDTIHFVSSSKRGNFLRLHSYLNFESKMLKIKSFYPNFARIN